MREPLCSRCLLLREEKEERRRLRREILTIFGKKIVTSKYCGRARGSRTFSHPLLSLFGVSFILCDRARASFFLSLLLGVFPPFLHEETLLLLSSFLPFLFGLASSGSEAPGGGESDLRRKRKGEGEREVQTVSQVHALRSRGRRIGSDRSRSENKKKERRKEEQSVIR